MYWKAKFVFKKISHKEIFCKIQSKIFAENDHEIYKPTLNTLNLDSSRVI